MRKFIDVFHGIEYSQLFPLCKKVGVKIAFENINSAEYLFETLEHFDEPHIGFCYDCGHEAYFELNECVQ